LFPLAPMVQSGNLYFIFKNLLQNPLLEFTPHLMRGSG
jgi:hypothetical protein